MGILINKNGQQLGPYSVEDARAMVLSGQLSATDWACAEGGTGWIPLKDVPGFAPPSVTGASSPPPESPNQEKELWEGHPSQLLNLRAYILWGIVLSVTLFL